MCKVPWLKIIKVDKDMGFNKNNQKAHLVGGGIASLAAAFFLIKDGNFLGKNIIIYDESSSQGNEIGGSLDGKGSPKNGYAIRGGRMLNFETFECTWNLLKTIPSLEDSSKSVFEEIVNFNKTLNPHSKARLIDKNRDKINVAKLGLTNKHRFELLKLNLTSERFLEEKSIEDYFSSSFFKTNFWYLMSTTFAFRSWDSVVEFKRYMNRFFHELYRLHTLSGVRRTRHNQYESLVLPIAKWLKDKGVVFELSTKVTNLEFEKINNKLKVIGINYIQKGKKKEKSLGEKDLVFVTNGSMVSGSSLGSMSKPPEISKNKIFDSWILWENLAKNKNFGNPWNFNKDFNKTKWESFTVTMKDPTFFKLVEEFSGNKPGEGGLITFKDSNWLMSIVLLPQPHFKNQPKDVKVFWGYGLFPERKGDFVNKKMSDCTGKEILFEVCSHLKFEKYMPLILKTSNCIPCMMPFITSQFNSRKKFDRPKVVPDSSINLAFIGQYCEIPKDVVFTVEYSVRSAQMAVYSLLCIEKKIPKIYEGKYNLFVLIRALKTLFR